MTKPGLSGRSCCAKTYLLSVFHAGFPAHSALLSGKGNHIVPALDQLLDNKLANVPCSSYHQHPDVFGLPISVISAGCCAYTALTMEHPWLLLPEGQGRVLLYRAFAVLVTTRSLQSKAQSRSSSAKASIPMLLCMQCVWGKN